jgi:hypothetical protein
MVNPKAWIEQWIEKWVALPPRKQATALVIVPILAYCSYCSVVVIIQPVIDSILEARRHDS